MKDRRQGNPLPRFPTELDSLAFLTALPVVCQDMLPLELSGDLAALSGS
jgi:hypothetical protein